MKTEHFDGINEVGFELTSVQDVLNALSLGMSIIDENECYLDADREGGEDGFERPATTDEIIEDAQTAFRAGGKIYAVIPVPTDKTVISRKQTLLSSGFGVGQEVYAMRNDKIITGKIVYLSLSICSYTQNLLLDERAHNLGETVFETIASEINPRFTNYYCLKKRDEVEREYKKVLKDNYALICVKETGGYKSYYTYGLNEIFATKEELIRHLLEEK